MTVGDFEKQVEEMVRDNWDKEALSSYDVWIVLRVLAEEFVFNLMQMRQTLIDYYQGGEAGEVRYEWVNLSQEKDEVTPGMEELCIVLRRELVENFWHLRLLQDGDIWEGMRRLEKRWMVGELNRMTEELEQYKKSHRPNDAAALHSAEEILSEIEGL